MNYTHLNVKTHYTLLNSLLTVDDLINLNVSNNFNSVAICDINSTFGITELYFKSGNMNTLLGVELVFEGDSFILYAKNYEGLQNIYLLTSLVNRDELTYEMLLSNSSNLICILNVKSKLYQLYLKNVDVTDSLNKLKLSFGDIYFMDTFEVVDSTEFCDAYNLFPVYGYEVNYAQYNDKKYYDLLQAIKNNEIYIRDNTGERKYFLSSSETTNLISKSMLSNVENIISQCSVKIPTKRLIPVFNKEIDSSEYLLALCKKGLEKRLLEVTSEYIERLKYELSVINEMGFQDYFLIVYDYVRFAKQKGILVGAGRGSAAGSLVSYVLGITDIDPIKYDLLFERFLNPERISWPDIDTDFEDSRRDEVVKYVVDKYGADYVGYISTFSTFASKQVLRDCAKAFGKNSADIKYLTENVNPLISLKKNYSTNQKFQMMISNDVENERIYQYAQELEGLVRHASIHAAGVVISNQNLDTVIGTLPGVHSKLISATMDNLEQIGLIKMDFLGLRNLTILRNVLEIIKDNEGIDIDISKIDLNDKKVLEIFSSGSTNGIFQFESEGMKKVLMNMQPKCFMDLAAANALHRPGPMDNIDEYINRMHGKKFDYIDNSLEPILSDTYGIIIYQEQIMEIARVVANFSYAKADILRSAMAKKKQGLLESQKDMFISGAVENGYEYDVAAQIYELILKFANYGFNKAHATSYSYLGYVLAYFKCYYFKEFMVVLLNNAMQNSSKVFDYINDCRLNGIVVEGVNVNLSETKFCIKDEKIIMPLTLIRGINAHTSDLIITERSKGDFTSFYNFTKRVALAGIKQQVVENLVYGNGFLMIDDNPKSVQIHAINGIIDMLGFYIDESTNVFDEEFVFANLNEYSVEEIVEFERNVLGFNFNNHPTSSFSDLLKINTLNIKKFVNTFVNMILYVEKVKVIKTKNGNDMAFVKCSDMYGTIDAVVFPKLLEKYNIEKGNLIYASCKVEYRNGKIQLVINNFKIRGG